LVTIYLFFILIKTFLLKYLFEPEKSSNVASLIAVEKFNRFVDA
jgi:hypothetical protein